MPVALSIDDVLLGEATSGTRSQRFADMIAIASAVKNRMDRLGQSVESIISAPGEFSAYGQQLPRGVEEHRSLARAAWDYVYKNGPTHRGTFYATPKAARNLPKGLSQVTRTAGHTFFEDPQGRAIQTAAGYIQPTEIDLPTVTNVSARTAAPNAGRGLRVAGFDPVSRPSRGMLELTPSLVEGERIGPGGISYTHADRWPVTHRLSDEAQRSLQMMGANVPGGIEVTSAYRSAAQNAAAGSGPFSQHRSGNAYDISLDGMTDVEKADAVEMARMSGATRIGAYSGNNSIHVDFADNYPPNSGYSVDVHPMFDKSVANMRAAPDWFRQGLAQTTVPTPTARPQNKGTDAATVLGLTAAPVGKVDRAPLGPAAPRRDAVPAKVEQASITPAVLGQGRTVAPSFASAQMLAPPAVKPSQSFVSPKAPTPNSDMTLAAQLASYGAGRVPNATPALAAMLSPTPGPLSQAQLMPPDIVPPSFVPAVPALPPAVPKVMPTVPRLKTPQARINEASAQAGPPPAPPQFTAADVYAGRAAVGQATGGNTVSRDAYGNTSVTNRYGVTTTTGPDGRQMAAASPYSGGGIAGPVGDKPTGGLSTPIGDGLFDADPALGGRSRFGNTVRGMGGAFAGSAIGGLAGPVGSIFGALVGAELAKPGGGRIGDFLSGVRTIDTSRVGNPMGMTFGPNTQFARAVSGGPFPDRPKGQSGALGGKDSNRSEKSMRDISPAATRDIKSGKAGLF